MRTRTCIDIPYPGRAHRMYVRALDDVRSVGWRMAFSRRGRAIYEFLAFLGCLRIQPQRGKPYCPVRICVRGYAN